MLILFFRDVNGAENLELADFANAFLSPEGVPIPHPIAAMPPPPPLVNPVNLNNARILPQVVLDPPAVAIGPPPAEEEAEINPLLNPHDFEWTEIEGIAEEDIVDKHPEESTLTWPPILRRQNVKPQNPMGRVCTSETRCTARRRGGQCQYLRSWLSR